MKATFKFTFLDCDIGSLHQELRAIGAFLAFGDHFRFSVFNSLANDQEYVQVRDEDHTVTLQIVRNGKVSQNIEGIVSYDRTIALLKALGFILKRSEEGYRLYYELDGIAINIDIWPGIPAYVQIEADSEETLYKICAGIGFDLEQAFFGDIHDIFRHYGIELKDIHNLVFAEAERPVLPT